MDLDYHAHFNCDDPEQVRKFVRNCEKNNCRAAVKENPGLTLGKLCDIAIRSLFPHTTLEYRAVAAYRMLETLYNAGEIRFEPELVPGWNDVPGRIFKIYSNEP